MAFSIFELFEGKDESRKKKKEFDFLRYLRERVSGVEEKEKVAKKIQETSEVTKTGSSLFDLLINPNPIQRKINEAVSSVPKKVIQSFEVKRNEPQLKTPLLLFDYILNPQRLGQELRKAKDNKFTNFRTELEKIGEWAKQIPHPVSVDRVRRFLSGENLLLLPKEKKVANEMKDYLNSFVKRGKEYIAEKPIIEIPGTEFKIRGKDVYKALVAEKSPLDTAVKGRFQDIPGAFIQTLKKSPMIRNQADVLRDIASGKKLTPSEIAQRTRLSKEDINNLLLGGVGGSGSNFSKQQISTVKSGILNNKEVRSLIGRFSQMVDDNPNINKKSLGLLGEYIHSLSETIFGKQAANLTNKQLRNALDAVMQEASKSNIKSSLSLGLQAKNIREGLRSQTRPGSFTNVKGIDNPMVFGKQWQRIRNVEESKKFVSEMLEESRRVKDPLNITNSFDDLVKKPDIPVQKKVNILDYLRTPNRVLEKIGMGDEAKLLRQKYDDYLLDLPKEIDKITIWSKRVPKSSNQRIFQWLDGDKIQLNNEELKVASEIKTYLKEWADKLKLPEEKRISNYITHIFEKGKIEKEFDPDLAKLIQGKVVKSVYDPFLQRRVGQPDYIKDTWQALDAYVKRATRKFHMDQALEKVAVKAENLPLESYNYVKGRIARINMQPTDIDNLIDNLVKSSPIGYRLGQRAVAGVSQTGRQMVSRGLLGLNPGTALRNLQQSTNTYATLGEKHFGIGLIKTVQNLPRLVLGRDTELEAVGVLGKNIVSDRTINATKKFWQYADDALFYMFNMAEKINRGIAYWGAKSKGLSQGMPDAKATQFAKDIVGKTQFFYDVIDTPAALQSDISKTLFQFAKYPLAQTEFLVEMIKNKNIAGSLRWVASNLLFLGTAGKILGLDIEDLFPDFSRFAPNKLTPPTLSPFIETGKAILNVPDEYGNISNEQNVLKRISESKDVQKGILNYVPAGGQLRKSIEGARAVGEGASLTPSGRVRFEVPQNFPSALQTVLFGQYSLPQAKEYFEKRESGKSSSEILYEEISSLPPNEKMKRIIKTKEENPQLYSSFKQLIRDEMMKTNTNEKRIRELPVGDGSRAKAIEKEFKKLETSEEKKKLLKEYLQKGIITQSIIKQLIKNKINLVE